MVKAMWGVTQGVKATNYYRAFGALTLSSNVIPNKVFFSGQTATDARNDLGQEGYLPENKSGAITALFVRMRGVPTDIASTTGVVGAMEALRDCDVVLVVNGTEVVRMPIWAANHPPSWTQGTFSLAAAADKTTTTVQNGGFMLQFTPHEVGPRQKVQVKIENPAAAVSVNPTAGVKYGGQTAINSGEIPVEVAIQVIDTKAV